MVFGYMILMNIISLENFEKLEMIDGMLTEGLLVTNALILACAGKYIQKTIKTLSILVPNEALV